MIEAYEDALKKSNKEFEEENEELKKQVEELKNKVEKLKYIVEILQNDNNTLKAQLDTVYLIFGKKGC